jgi:hypothetical protein
LIQPSQPAASEIDLILTRYHLPLLTFNLFSNRSSVLVDLPSFSSTISQASSLIDSEIVCLAKVCPYSNITSRQIKSALVSLGDTRAYTSQNLISLLLDLSPLQAEKTRGKICVACDLKNDDCVCKLEGRKKPNRINGWGISGLGWVSKQVLLSVREGERD